MPREEEIKNTVKCLTNRSKQDQNIKTGEVVRHLGRLRMGIGQRTMSFFPITICSMMPEGVDMSIGKVVDGCSHQHCLPLWRVLT